MEAVASKYHVQKVTLLREFVTSVGIQLHLREYDFDAKTMFNESDILNMFPKVKHINPTASDAYNFYQSGQNKIQVGESFECYFLNISGRVNHCDVWYLIIFLRKNLLIIYLRKNLFEGTFSKRNHL